MSDDAREKDALDGNNFENNTQDDFPQEIGEKLLYHYCDMNALFSILRNKQIWLSHTTSMNDYMERHYFEGFFGRIIDLIINKNQDKSEKIKRMELLKQYSPSNNTTNNLDPFICCFSEDGDLLSQWRAYANDGQGVSIGFSPDKLELPDFPPGLMSKEKFALCPVIYDQSKQVEITFDLISKYEDLCDAPPKRKRRKKITEKEVREAIASTISDINRTRKIQGLPPITENDVVIGPEALSGRADPILDYASSCMDAAHSYSLIIKNPAFSEEREWRLMFTPIRIEDDATHPKIKLSKMDYRLSRNLLCPYYKMDISEQSVFPIKKIVLGPKNPYRSDHYPAYRFLEHCGLDISGINIVSSSASYR